ncbi:hypothetical protein [Bacillus sp. T3]|uniref:hypothetical protein n=1 Tax=Bacillus sp. T3 TaxID=467262 RepID=UPI002981AF60|nr:hypothetical protein [Bacillus sp. T3]
MSFAHFDELLEICWGMAEEKENQMMIKPVIEQLDFLQNYDPNHFWEKEEKEIVKERELMHV